jgi:ubiquinol-cytochrome c reductase cytochrome c1 subunit
MRMLKSALLASLMLATAAASFAAEEGGATKAFGADWKHWRADNEVDNTASLQRGARNFMNYCAGCHSLKYMRYSRMGEDLGISEAVLKEALIHGDAKPADYIKAPMPPADAEAWFGKAPPDLSVITRARGTDYVYQFLKTFYLDPAKPTGVNNLALDGTAMPHVLADLEGVKQARYKTGAGEGGASDKVFEGFEVVAPGKLSPAEFDGFVRDTVNFLVYVGEPAQVKRQSLGVWVILFLLVFTGISWLLYQEYWKDVH